MKKFYCFLLVLVGVVYCSNVVQAQVEVMNTIAGSGSIGYSTGGYSGDGGEATAAQLNGPFCVKIDRMGNIYIADLANCVIRKIDTSGIISTIAGNKALGPGYSGDGGTATAAQLYNSEGLAVDNIGNIYIADEWNNVVRKVNTLGIISTIAGNYLLDTGYSGDGGAATAAQLYNPKGIAVDGSGNIYIADAGNNVVRMVNSIGVISTIAGNDTAGYNGDGGAATAAELVTPWGVAVDGIGNIYISSGCSVRKVNTSGIISTVAGSVDAGALYVGDGGPATDAGLNLPAGLTIDMIGNLYIADAANNVIRKVDTDGIITTVAGDYSFGYYGYSGDGGAATATELYYPYDVAVDSSGNIYIADTYNNRIRKVTLCSTCSCLTGTFYLDLNSDCLFDTGDVPLAYWDYALINNTAGDTIYGWCDYNGGYSALLQDSDSYTVIADPFGYFTYLASTYGIDSIIPSCPTSGVYTLSLLADTATATENFAFSCTPPTELDMATSSWDWGFVPGDTGVVMIWGGSYWGYICDSLSSAITLTLDPTLIYSGMWYGPTPTVSGSTLSWTFSTTDDLLDFFAAVAVATSSTDSLGTLVCNTVHVTPTALSDPDTSDNTYSWCEPVTASFDPNGKEVSPIGTGPEGYIANETPLSYMIHFQNTGTASATNITISDTINSNLNIATLQILNSSAPVNVSEGSGNVITFKFSNINLPDSASNPSGSIGYVAYNIMPYPALKPGTQITNRAAIYFDYNPAVYTNTTLNTIEYPTGVQEVSPSLGNVEIYPNPVSDILTIKMDANTSFSSFNISNSIGELLLEQRVTASQMGVPIVVGIKSLPAGVYYVTFNGESGMVVKKFVKM